MNTSDSQEETRISIGELIQQLANYVQFLIANIRWMVLVGLAAGLVWSGYLYFKRPVYTAETTFVLQSSGGGGENISSLASVVGINLNALSDESTLFQEDNILELYRSRNMIYQAFLTKVDIGSEQQRLISYWANFTELLPKWRGHLEDPTFSFEIPVEEFTVKHDSLIFEVIKDFKEENLSAEKPDRLLSILSVRVRSKDQDFSKSFNEVLVKKVNDFYLETETKKTGENLRVLTRQADSVRVVLEETMLQLAIINEQQPNLNPLYRQVRLPKKKVEIDLQANATIYQEVVKNLEIAKITHRNNTPLIQIIDEPRYPIASNHYSAIKALFFGGLYAGLLALFGFSAYYLKASIQESLA
ncbi:MAG: exopolysaccharide biosynthesis protein [Cyclobacteriaceae bacterium]